MPHLEEEDEEEAPATLYAISDIHVDAAANMEWVESLAPRRRDGLILAGDVTHDLGRLKRTFRCLKEKYAEVYFVPGNHDLWLDRNEATSIDKLETLFKVCEAAGVRTKSHVFGNNRRVVVVPMLSWHHASFDTEPQITNWHGIPSARLVMTDYRRCKWPDPLRDDDDSVAKYVDGLNGDDATTLVARERARGSDVVSFSHFLPRIELLPEKRYLFLPTLAKAVGSTFLGNRVQALGPDVHCFAHTHFGWDATLDGVRYIQAALAYPNEWKNRPQSLAIGDLATDTRKHPVKIWDADQGVVSDRYHASWSAHYDKYPRVPTITNVLPPYTAKLYKPLPGSMVKPVHLHVEPFDAAAAATS